ncbi:alpha carbonic anhydrase 7 [Artemisia annua]|uniref:Alpha carbonic anhydrase 7 n=1 Tax=Artemisia annua TaxID=35608 RepID=A0A2U1KX90_ARTAN|nr:alpha carbonic anhydrase 7 [Artemisia annua]
MVQVEMLHLAIEDAMVSLELGINHEDCILLQQHMFQLRWIGGSGARHIHINGTEYQLNQIHWHTATEHTIKGQSNMKESVGCLVPLVDVTVHLRYTCTRTAFAMSDGFISATPMVSSCVIGLFQADFAIDANAALSDIFL